MDFIIHIEKLNENNQRITAINLPDGTIINRENDTIDFEPLKKFINMLFIFTWNGVADPSVKVLKSVGLNADGIAVFHYDEFPAKENINKFS